MQLTDTGPADPRAPRSRRSLLWASGALILAALGLVVWTEVRQFQLIGSATQRQDDYAQVSLGYLESEYLRLRLAWAEAIGAPRPDRDALQLRYDIFVSRVDLLDTERSRLILRADDVNERAYRQIRRFIAEADAVLGPRAPALEVAELQRLLPALEAIDQPVHSMVIDGSHHLSHVITQRTAAMRETNHITLLLTVLLTTATFGFALLSLAQYRRLDLRRRSLEAVTEDLRKAQRVAEDASAAKTNFLANMSHEIRTPLQGVLGMMALLADSPLSPDQQRRLETARNSADHLLALLNDILDLTKLEAGKLAILARPVDLPRLLGEIDALMRAQAVAKGLAFRVEVTPGLPHWVELDPTRVRQVLLNLCSNAIKFTTRGHVEVAAARAGGRLRLTIEDTGIGIDAATLGQLFKRFSRGNQSRTRHHGGSGLGLEISRQLARLMGGDIEVDSTPGQGSRFVLDLPLREAAVPAAAPEPAATPPASPAMAAAGRLVLVADDNEVNRDFTGAVLEHLGHRVVHAADGHEAIAKVRELAVDLVLMDLHMPGTDGLEATREIRRLATPRARVPIVALTADAFAETREACLSAGMDGFVAKPVSPAELGLVMAQFGSLAGAPAGR